MRMIVIAALLSFPGRQLVAQSAPTKPGPRFEFHSDVWINLHHFLYSLAQPPGPPPRAPAVSPVGVLSESEQRTWNDAIAYYRSHVIQHDLLFDNAMLTVKEALATAERDSLLTESFDDRDLVRVLNDAAPIYRRHWWPTHDAMNRLWIAALEPLLERLGPRLANQLSAAYETPWYTPRIRVDVSAHAGTRLVAYTTGTTQGHVVVSSTDPCDQGYAALETLFHEASHTIVDGAGGTVGDGIIAAAKARHVPPPADLWHALMFYTQGEFLRQDLGELGVAYDPESGICDVYRGPWAQYRDAAALFWLPHMHGRVSLDSALARIIDALSGQARSLEGRPVSSRAHAHSPRARASREPAH